MFDLTTKIVDETRAVERTAARVSSINIKTTAFAVMTTAKESLDKAPKGRASEPGTPPHTHKGAYMRRAIRYVSDAFGAVIGPLHSRVGLAGQAHEFGGMFGKTRKAQYPERPYMRPALEENLSRFANSWNGSVNS